MADKFKAWALYSKSFIIVICVVIVTFVGSWIVTIWLLGEGKNDTLEFGETFAIYSDSLDYDIKLQMVLEREIMYPEEMGTQRIKARLFVIEGGRIEEGMLIAENIISQRDRDNESVYTLSFAYTALGYPVLGEYYAKQSLAIKQTPRGSLALAEAYYAQERYGDASVHYARAAYGTTLEEEFYKRIIDGYLKLNDWKGAEAYATKRVRAAKSESYYFDVLYEHYSAENDFDNILLYGKMYYNICVDPEVPRVGEILGDTIMANKNEKSLFLDAGKYYYRAFTIGGDYNVLFKAARAFALGRDAESAKKYLAECIAADENFKSLAAQQPELEGMYE